MGASQSVETPQPTQKSDVTPASENSETSTQTDDVVNEGASNEAIQPGSGADSAAVNTDNESDSSVIPDKPPPYTRLGEDVCDDTSVKRDLSSESKKSPPDNKSLDDLKFAIEKSNIDFNERLATLEKSLQSNIEHQGKTSKALMDLQDTVYAYFETRNEDVTISRQGDDTRRRDQFTERLGKHVVEHLLNSEVFKDMMQQGMGIGQIEEQQEKVLEHNKDNESITSQTDKPESWLLEDNTDLSIMMDYIHKIPSDLASVSLDDFREVSFDENKPENPVICKDKKQKDFRIDSNVWKLCMNKVDKGYEAKQLLEMGILPDKYLLKKIGSELNRRSDIFQSICQCICLYIKTRSSKIVNVWTAFRYNKFDKHCGNEIIFVVITKEPEEAIDIEYETYQRCLYDVSDKCDKENSRIRLEENKHRIHDAQIADLTKCLKYNAKQLMKKHTNLTRATISWVKSSEFGSEQCSLKQSPCLALYVQIKGLVPIDEDPFDEFVGGYPVDVREGVFTFCGFSTDLHQNVKMGCALDSGFGSLQGTIGPFIRFQSDPHTYLLTSAHVLLNPDQMKRLIMDNNVYYGLCGNDAFQPPENTTVGQGTRHHLGKIELAVYKEGGDGNSGMEIALVKIDENRIPVDGRFPDSNVYHNDFGTNNPFEFPTERICNLSNISSASDVYKFGAFSGLTKGKVRVQGSSVRYSMLVDNYTGVDVVLHQQIEIENVDDQTFGVQGDSGSLVLKRENDQLSAVGLFEGKMGNVYMVTPIVDIKQELSKALSLNREPPSQVGMDIDDDNFSMAMKLYYVPTNVNSTQQAGMTDNVSAEISRQTTDLQRNIMHSTDHKINSVKTELTVIKQHIDNTKNEIMSNIQEMENRVTGNISSQIDRLFRNLQSQGNT